MATRSECAAIDFVMESAAITRKQQVVAVNKAAAMSHKAENRIPKEENEGVDWGNRPHEEVLCVGAFAARTMCATEHSIEHRCRLVQQVCRLPHRAKEYIKIQGQPSQSARGHRAGLNVRSRADESQDEQKADAFLQVGKLTATINESRDIAESKRRIAEQR